MWIITLLGAVLSVPVVVAVAGFLNGVSAKFLTMKVQLVVQLDSVMKQFIQGTYTLLSMLSFYSIVHR